MPKCQIFKLEMKLIYKFEISNSNLNQDSPGPNFLFTPDTGYRGRPATTNTLRTFDMHLKDPNDIRKCKMNNLCGSKNLIFRTSQIRSDDALVPNRALNCF